VLDKNEITKKLQTYIETNPKAADNLDGIIAFWLGFSICREDDRVRVRQAIAELIAAGKMTEHVKSDRERFFLSTIDCNKE